MSAKRKHLSLSGYGAVPQEFDRFMKSYEFAIEAQKLKRNSTGCKRPEQLTLPRILTTPI